MGRTLPPAAIIAPPLVKVVTETKGSDLPLRQFVPSRNPMSASAHDLPPTPPDSTPGLSNLTSPASATDFVPPTPSSIAVEPGHYQFDGDDDSQIAFQAVDIAAEAFRSYSRSRSETAHSEVRDHSRNASRSTARRPRSPARDPRSPVRDPRSPSSGSRVAGPPGRASTPGNSAVGQSRSTARSQSRKGRAPEPPAKDDAAERCKRYVQGVIPVDGNRELLMENTSLQQRIAALQRVERDLLAENHELVNQMTSLKRHHEARRKRWRDQFQERERAFHARIQALEDRILQQDEELQRQRKTSPSSVPLISDDEIVEWFSTRTRAWEEWADEFAHQDPKRLQSGLLPVQTIELCESVKSFIQLYDDGLPEELVNSDGDGDVKGAQILLHGMLANFIIEETLQSPFWVFDVLSASGNDLESPSVVHANSPIGFRVELALWSSVAPPRSARLPPKSAMLVKEPLSARRLPPPATAVPSLTLHTAGLSGPPPPEFPRKKEMENFYQLLSNVQHNNRDMHAWRAQMLQTLSEGGLSMEPENIKGEDRRRLADARKTYAKKLKDRFLSGAARFLLKEENNLSGIDKLEHRLVKEFDLALQFSCLVWSRHDPLRIKGLQELAKTTFVSSDETMELCESQAPAQVEPRNEATDMPPGYHDGHKVVMAVQPVIEFVSVVDNSDDQEISKILSKARVLVAVPGTRPQKPAVIIEHNKIPDENERPGSAGSHQLTLAALEGIDSVTNLPQNSSPAFVLGIPRKPKSPQQVQDLLPELLPNTSYRDPHLP